MYKNNSSKNSLPNNNSASSSGKNSWIIDHSVTVSLPGIDKKDIAVFACDIKEQFMIEPLQGLRHFSLFVGVKNTADLAEKIEKNPEITITFNAKKSDKNDLVHQFFSPISTIIPAERTIIRDYYCYQLIYDALEPFPELSCSTQDIYTGSVYDRITKILEKSGLKDTQFSVELKNDSNKKAFDHLTVQFGSSYWYVLIELMQQHGITCFFNQQGKLVFSDSPNTLEEVNYGLTTIGDLMHQAKTSLTRFVGLFNLRKNQRLNTKKTRVQANSSSLFDNRLFIAESGQSTLTQNYVATLDHQNAAQTLADQYQAMHEWRNTTYTAKSYVLPLALGQKIKATWASLDTNGAEKKHQAILAPYSSHFRISYFRQFLDPNMQQEHPDYQFLHEWTGFAAEEFITRVKLVDAQYLPTMEPFNYLQKPAQTLYGVVLDKSDKTTGEKARIDKNKIMIGLLPIARDSTSSGYLAIASYEFKPSSLLSATPAPGTLVLVTLDSFGQLSVMGYLRTQDWADVTRLNGNGKEAEGNDNSATVSITNGNVILKPADTKTFIELNNQAFKVETGEASVAMTKDSIGIESKKTKIKAHQELDMESSNMKSSASKTQINKLNLVG